MIEQGKTNQGRNQMSNIDTIKEILSEAIAEAAKVALEADGTAYEAAMVPAIMGITETFRALNALEG